ncbi:MAG TPA: hypothetical protein ENN05_02975 [Deltaproteobacteria bacterium]|nr:hypothetical protein [Deltaproteobacteria bacterium]
MSRILKPVSLQGVEYVHQICAQYFVDEHGFKIVEYNLGNTFTGKIDLLATNSAEVFLITLNMEDFPGALLRSFMGLRWFRENLDFLKRVYPPEDIDLNLPVGLIILSKEFPPEIHSILAEVCSVRVHLYRYEFFGSVEDPDIFIRDIRESATSELQTDQDLGELRKELGIEPANMSDEEIREFQAAMKA